MNTIKMYRLKKGYSQKKLADKVGVAQQAVCRWEDGTAMPRAERLAALARALSCTADDLLTDDKQER